VTPASIWDYRALAKSRLPPIFFEYLDGGSYSEITLKRNIEDLESVALRQRVLRDVSNVDTSTVLFGQPLSMPVILAPIGLAGMNARRGECQAIRAATEARVPFCLSTVSVCEDRLNEGPVDLTDWVLRAVREERPSGAAPRRPIF
jgi:L-lactate dehydrogenase (cytochrome)